MHGSAAARIGTVSGVLRRLAAFLLLTMGLLLWAEETDARLARDARLADGVRAIGLSQTAPAAHRDEISPYGAQPAYPAGSLGGLFSRPGMIGGFAAGFLGAGIFGLLFGHGVIGELSGASSILGLIFQFALLLAFSWLIRTWWRADRAATTVSPRQLADAYQRDRNETLPDFVADANAGTKADSKNSFADGAHSPL